MSTHRHIDLFCIGAFLLTLLLTLLFMNGERIGLQPVADADGEAGTEFFTANDLKGDWSTDGATQIELEEDQIRVYGGGAYALGSDLYITNAGRFILSGRLENGSVFVDTNKTAKVWLLLDGVEISCNRDACLHVEQADKVFLTLAEGSENRLHCTGISQEALEAGVDGVIFSRDDLTINGSGSLKAESDLEHGIAVHDTLVITGGDIHLSAPLDAIHIRDGLRIRTATLSVRAGDDGISVNEPESLVYIESGTLEITAADQGIMTLNTAEIAGGSLAIRVGGDGIESDNSLIISGGSLTIEAGDEGLCSENNLLISGGKTEILSCQDGIKAMVLDITGGSIRICPADDGLVASVRDSVDDLVAGTYGTGETHMRITGGEITVDLTNSDGTALNAHRKAGGTLEISGGEICVICPNGEEKLLKESPSGEDQTKQLWK